MQAINKVWHASHEEVQHKGQHEEDTRAQALLETVRQVLGNTGTELRDTPHTSSQAEDVESEPTQAPGQHDVNGHWGHPEVVSKEEFLPPGAHPVRPLKTPAIR